MKAKALIGVALATLLGWTAAVDAEVYRWVDEQGRVHYSDMRPVPPAPAENPEPARPSEPEILKGPETVKDAEPKTSTPAAQARPEQQAPIAEVLEATSTKEQEEMPGVGRIVGGVVMILGYIVIVGSAIWLIFVGFKKSVVWGLMMLLVSPMQLAFVWMCWQEAKRPFLVQLAGLALVIIGALIAASSGRPG